MDAPETIATAAGLLTMKGHRRPLSAADLSAYIDGELGWRRRRGIRRHLRDCEPCRHYVAQVSGVVASLRATPPLVLSPRARAELQSAYSKWASTR